MSKKGYKQSSEHITKRAASRSHPNTEEAKANMKGKCGVYERTLEHGRKIAESRIGKPGPNRGKTLSEMNHKSDCSCGICKATRGETRGESNSMFGHHYTEETLQQMKEVHKGQWIGDKNPNWRGGISSIDYPLEFNNEFKELVRERYNYTCMICKLTQEQVGHTLNVHHIDYDKDNLDPDNFVPVCKSYHSVTSGNRDYWTEVLQNTVEMNKSFVGAVE